MPQEVTKKEILDQSAKDVFEQLAKDSSLAIVLDPDVAEHMGAFEEKAVSIDDIDDDVFLNENGELSHGSTN